MKKAKQTCGNADEEIVAEERGGTLGEEELCGLKDIEQGMSGERKAAVEKVSYWLKSTSSSAASGIARGGEDTRMKESFSELETEERDYRLSPGEQSPLLDREYPHRGCDETTSLLELRDRFVRKVHSILVEGNNETDDMSSSAEEMDSATSAVPRPEGKGQRNSLQQGVSSRTVKMNLSETPPESIKDRTNLKAQNQEFVMQKGDESTILAGHFDDDYQQSPVKKEAVGLAKNEGKCIELVQNPTGKVEWTVGGTEGSTGQHEIPISGYPQECRAVSRGTASSAHATPEKISAFGMNAQRSPTRSVQRSHCGKGLQASKKPQIMVDAPDATPEKMSAFGMNARRSPARSVQRSHCGKRLQASKKPQMMVETPVKDSSKDILNNIVDFFKAPLPQLLSSPMPVLSPMPMAKLRTARGRRICGPLFKEEKVKEASPCPANLASSHDCHSRGNQTAKEIMVNVHNTQSSVSHMQNGEVTNSSSGANKTKSQVIENRAEFKYPQRPKTVNRSTSSTETSDDNVFLLQEGCSSSSGTQDDKSRACSVDACGDIEATKVIREKHFVKVSRSPMISSPLGHMTLSDREVSLETSDTQETKMDCRSPGRSSQGLVFDDCGHTSKDKGNSSDSMEMLEFSSSDDIGDGNEESLNLLEETASSSENQTVIPQKVQNVRFTSGEAYSQEKLGKIRDLVIPKQREKDYVSPAKAYSSIDDKKVAASYSNNSPRHESSTETVRKNNQNGINSDTFIISPRKSLDVYSRFPGKNNKQISPCKPRLEHSQTVEKRAGSPSCSTVRERLSSPLRIPEVSASKIRSDHHYHKKTMSNDKPLAYRDSGKKPMEGVKVKRSSPVHLVSPRVPNRSKPPAKTSSSAKCAKTNVSFLSSTRLDEDPTASDSIGCKSLVGKLIADPNVNGNEKVLRGTQIAHKGTPQKSSGRGVNLCSVPQSAQSPSRLPVRGGGISQRRGHVEVPRGGGSSPLRKSLTPSKRMRPGCDRASLESPAKKRTPDRPVMPGARDPRPSHRATSQCTGATGSVQKKLSSHVPRSRDRDFPGSRGGSGGGRRDGGDFFRKSAPSSRTQEDASMSSSMCEGKGKCKKTVCFTCAVNDA